MKSLIAFFCWILIVENFVFAQACDISPIQVLTPASFETLRPNQSFAPRSSFRNNSLNPAITVRLRFEILNQTRSTVYAADTVVSSLPPMTTATIVFRGLSTGLSTGEYVARVSSLHDDDPNLLNDVIADTFFVNWYYSSSLNYRKLGPQATLLLDGTVLLSGGSLPTYMLETCEIFSPSMNNGQGGWRVTDSMEVPRAGHTATLQHDGKVLVTGGLNRTFARVRTCELFDPLGNGGTGTWAFTDSMAYRRSGHTATLLQDGRVLVGGGYDPDGNPRTLNTCEIFDPLAAQWTATAPMNIARCNHLTVLLPSGKVLAVGGRDAAYATTLTAEVFNPAGGGGTGSWTLIASIPFVPVTATQLLDGKTLFTEESSSRTVIFDPVLNNGVGGWVLGPYVPNYDSYRATTLLPSGKVLLVGGGSATTHLFDAHANGGFGAWRADAKLASPRESYVLVALRNGKVLLASGGSGGFNTTDSTYLYDSAPVHSSNVPSTLSFVGMFPEQPFRNAPFSVFVETRDSKGRIQNVPRSTTIRLTLQAGNGHLFGNLAGVLHAGANRLRISDVIYDLAEDSVRLIASVHSGTPLENDTSAFFSMRVGTLPSEPILHYPADQQIMQTDTVLCRWTKSNPDARSYWIELSTDSSFTNARVDSAATDTIAVVRSLLDNKTYWWRVKAKNLAGWGLMSQPRRFRTNIPPARPIGCSDAGVSDATLFWKRGEEDMDKYYIYCDTTSSPMILVDSTLHRNDTTKTFRGLSSGIRYFFRIVAIDSAGNRSLLSPDVTARPGLFGAMQSALWNSLDDDVAVWGDYDGDDDLDLLTMGARDTMRHAYLHRNDGDGRFSRSQLQLPLLYAPQVNCYDYNNDGMLDMLMTGTRFQMAFFHSMKIVRNLGNNVFAEVNTTFPEAEGPGVGLFDYNNDGREDIAISSSNVFGTASTVVYRNCGGGEYTRTKLLGLGLPGGWNASVLPFDCDQDCDADVLLAGYGASYFTKLFRNGGAFNDSIWIFSEIASSFKNFSSQHIAAADYDNDGDLDFVINGNPPGLALYRNNGGGSFTLDSSCGLPPLRNEIAWGDYDNDGDVDLLVSGTSITAYGFRVYHNNGDRTFSLAYSHPNDDSTGSCTFADYDRDGDLDVLSVASHVARRTTVVYKNLTSNLNTPPSPPTNLTATVTSNTVRLSWHRGTDAQTPSPGLSYNVRVGTTREGCEIKSSGSSPLTGFRRLPRSGNVYQDTSWLIRELAPGKYYWSVQSIDNAFAGSVFAPTDSFEVIVATTPINKQLPSEIGLHQNHPNPFNPSTTINVNVPSQANLALKIYDVLGKEVKSFEYENVPAGTHQVVWDGKNQGGAQVASGVYFYRLNAGTTVLTKQMLLLK